MHLSEAANRYSAALAYSDPPAPPTWQQMQYKPLRSLSRISPAARASKPALGDIEGIFDSITRGIQGGVGAVGTVVPSTRSTPSWLSALGLGRRVPMNLVRQVATGGRLPWGALRNLNRGTIPGGTTALANALKGAQLGPIKQLPGFLPTGSTGGIAQALQAAQAQQGGSVGGVPAAAIKVAQSVAPQAYKPSWLSQGSGSLWGAFGRTGLGDDDGMDGVLDDLKDAGGALVNNVNDRLDRLDLALKIIIGLSGVAALTGTVQLFRRR